MRNVKILLAGAALAVTGLAAPANAAPWGHGHDRFDRHPVARHEFHRPIVARIRVHDVLRFHHYRWMGDPYFARGHYVVRSINPFGRTVFVQLNPYTGAFMGELRF